VRDIFDGVAQLANAFFNKRPARSGAVEEIIEKRGVTIQELIRRKESVILVDGKLWRMIIEPANVEEKP
jgi:hypothetical protein